MSFIFTDTLPRTVSCTCIYLRPWPKCSTGWSVVALTLHEKAKGLGFWTLWFGVGTGVVAPTQNEVRGHCPWKFTQPNVEVCEFLCTLSFDPTQGSRSIVIRTLKTSRAFSGSAKHGRGLSPHKMSLSSPTVKHAGEELGAQLCGNL